MIVYPTYTISAVDTSPIIKPYQDNALQFGQLNAQPITNIGLICTVSAGADLTYSIEVTGDQVPSQSGHWNLHEVINNLTGSQNSNILYAISAFRLNVTAWTSGSVTLGSVQWS